MASRAPIMGALMRAPSNIVRLPTAAPRKPQNHRYAAQHHSAVALRKAEPWPGEYRYPGEREADRVAADIANIERSPALELLVAMLEVLDNETRVQIARRLAPGAVTGRTTARQALALLRSTRLTIGQQLDLSRAFERREGC